MSAYNSCPETGKRRTSSPCASLAVPVTGSQGIAADGGHRVLAAFSFCSSEIIQGLNTARAMASPKRCPAAVDPFAVPLPAETASSGEPRETRQTYAVTWYNMPATTSPQSGQFALDRTQVVYFALAGGEHPRCPTRTPIPSLPLARGALCPPVLRAFFCPCLPISHGAQPR